MGPLPKYFIRLSQPGQFRGQGIWSKINTDDDEEVRYWAHCASTGYLPVAESCEPHDVKDSKGEAPMFVLANDQLFHVAGYKVPIGADHDEQTLRFWYEQLTSLVDQLGVSGV